jgi:phosphoribosylamine--glycine ligase
MLTHDAPDADDIVGFALSHEVDLVVVGPEAPLVDGVADHLRAAGIRTIGPGAAAAQIEGSKSFAKDIMARAGVPTAAHRTVTTHAEARNAIAEFGFPVVLKMDGLAGGKGVVIAHTSSEAGMALKTLLPHEGRHLVIEEFLTGEELSYIVLTDGRHFMALPPSQDHKRLLDRDEGPNTGGMGAFSDDHLLSASQEAYIQEHIIRPVLRTLREMDTPFQGFLYAGLMMTASGPRVLEFNARLGDPETQVILPRLQGDLLLHLVAAANHELQDGPLPRTPGAAVTVVVASAGYPVKPQLGTPIHGLVEAEDAGCLVFHAGTKGENGDILTAGGRVLAVTSAQPTLPQAIAHAYEGVERIHFEGMQFRHDIGGKGLKHWRDSR